MSPMSTWVKTITPINTFLNAILSILFKNRGNNIVLRLFQSVLTGELISYQHKMCPYTYITRVSRDLRELQNYPLANSNLEPWLYVAQSHIKKGDTVFDIGAHIGRHTIHFSHLCGDNGTVYAFEPDRDNYEILQNNISRNRIINCKTLPIALSDKQTNTTLHLNPNSSEGHSIIAKNHTWSSDQHEHIKVKCQTLDAVCKTNDIDKIKLLKIDVEGAHFLVLHGATRMLSQRTIDLIICEAGTNTQHISGRTDKELLTQMVEYGYSPFLHDGDDLVRAFASQEHHGIVDFIFISNKYLKSIQNYKITY